MTITAVIHEAEEGGCWGEVPSLPGCMTEGGTVEAVKAALQEAVQGWLEVAGDIAKEKAAQDVSTGTHRQAQLVELAI
jgi:predicted RNase H-like HicB family nuclease